MYNQKKMYNKKLVNSSNIYIYKYVRIYELNV